MTTKNEPGKPASTEQLIQRLSIGVGKSRTADTEIQFFLKWLAVATVLVVVWIAVLPNPIDLRIRLENPWFDLNSILWFAGTALSALLVHRDRIPGQKSSRYTLAVWAAVFLLLFFIAVRLPGGDLRADFSSEMNWYRGRCGPIILFMGAMWAGGLFWWTRKGAPTRLSRTGLWIGLSAGCLASLAMQVICAHENPLHVLIWHVTPVTALAGFGYVLGAKWLRW